MRLQFPTVLFETGFNVFRLYIKFIVLSISSIFFFLFNLIFMHYHNKVLLLQNSASVKFFLCYCNDSLICSLFAYFHIIFRRLIFPIHTLSKCPLVSSLLLFVLMEYNSGDFTIH